MLFWKKNSICGWPTPIQESNLLEVFIAVFNKKQHAETRTYQNKSMQIMRNNRMKLIEGTTANYDAL